MGCEIIMEKKKSKSKIVFILTIVFLVITIICFLYGNHVKQEYDEYWEEHLTDDIKVKSGKMTESEFNRIKRQEDKLEKTQDITEKASFILGGCTIVLLATGIVLKVKENKSLKGGYKN